MKSMRASIVFTVIKVRPDPWRRKQRIADKGWGDLLVVIVVANVMRDEKEEPPRTEV